MDSAHDRFETLAVGHVLGGLEASDAAEFRSHLQTCGTCRRRVTELRGIADDLAAAERDERAQARVRTEVPPPVTDDTSLEPPGLPTVSVRAVGVLVLLVLVVLGGLGFWNLHLRTQVATVLGATERLETTLGTIASGVPLEATFSGTVRGQLVSDGEVVAFALTALPPLAADERVVVWRLGAPDGDDPVLLASPQDGTLAGAIEVAEATEVLVTVESLTSGPPREPAGRPLARAALDTPAG